MDRQRRASSSHGPTVVAVLAVLAVMAALYFWWRAQQPAEIPHDVPVAAQPAPPAASASVAGPPPIRHPIEPVPDTAGAAAGEAGLTDALNELLGRRSVLSFLQADNFAGRMVATVDNLARPHAAVQMWPVLPSPGRFTVESQDPPAHIATVNHRRYEPLVDFIEGVNTQRAVAVYRRFYPQFQQAYEQLGYPGLYFNDRLVEVIDHLLAAPEPEPPLAVTLTEVKGPMPSQRPWVHYEFADPALASLSSGQKMMVRVGLANERRLKAKLTEIRREIARQAQSAR